MKLEEYETLSDKEGVFEMIIETVRIHYETDNFFSYLDELYDLNQLATTAVWFDRKATRNRQLIIVQEHWLQSKMTTITQIK